MKVLIIDDDIALLEAMKKAIDWQTLGVDAVQTAAGPGLAKKALLQGTVDLVICDIEMPVESGIGLLAWVREQGIDCEFLFLTCHERFDFASEALKLGAVSYVLKPFDPGRMTQELLRVLSRIEEKKVRNEYEKMGALYLSNRSTVENAFWQEVLYSQKMYTEEEILELAEKHGIRLDAMKGTMILITIDNTEIQEGDVSASRMGILEYKMRKACISELLSEKEEPQSMTWHSAETIFVMMFTFINADIESRCHRAMQSCRKEASCEVRIWISKDVPLREAARTGMHMMETNRKQITPAGSIRIWSPDLLEERNEKAFSLPEMLEVFSGGNKTKILKTILDAVSGTEAGIRTHDQLRSIQQNIVQGAYVYLYQNGVQPDLLFVDELYERLSYGAVSSMTGMMRWLNVFVDRVLQGVDQARQHESAVDRAKKYILSHCREKITRKEVAEHVYLTPEYLGRIFKRDEGISINAYIMECRINEAKELLESDSLSIGEIADRMGFDNPSYFVTVFRKEAGMSPSEWRKKSKQI